MKILHCLFLGNVLTKLPTIRSLHNLNEKLTIMTLNYNHKFISTMRFDTINNLLFGCLVMLQVGQNVDWSCEEAGDHYSSKKVFLSRRNMFCWWSNKDRRISFKYCTKAFANSQTRCDWPYHGVFYYLFSALDKFDCMIYVTSIIQR